MDQTKLSVTHQGPMQKQPSFPIQRRRMNKNKEKEEEEAIKVVHFSNPLKVTATVSEFKGLVQELTGQDSDVSKFTNAGNEAVAASNVSRGSSGPAASMDDMYVDDGHHDLPETSGSMYYFESSSQIMNSFWYLDHTADQ